jgi:hypothetical protein
VSGPRPISLSFTLDSEWLADFMSTACDGGVTYWADATMDDDGVARLVHDDPNTGEERTTEAAVDRDVIERGVVLALSRGFKVRDDIRAQIFEDVVEGVCSMDREAADVVVQCGLFGAIVFG